MKVTIKKESDFGGKDCSGDCLWICIEGKDNIHMAVTEEELLPIRDAINHYYDYEEQGYIISNLFRVRSIYYDLPSDVQKANLENLSNWIKEERKRLKNK
jgi:hypothetical protein